MCPDLHIICTDEDPGTQIKHYEQIIFTWYYIQNKVMMQDVKMEDVSSFRHIPGLPVSNFLAFAITVVLF